MPTPTETILEQNFIERNNVAQHAFGQAAQRHNAAMGSTDAEAARGFLQANSLTGALAASRLDKSATADKVLELRATHGQPA